MIKLWMEDNSGQVPDESDLRSMADTYGMTSVPNLADGKNVWVDFENDYGIPTYSVIGPDMKILAADTNNTKPSAWLD